MKFWYNVMEVESIDINFQEVYDYITKNVEGELSPEEVCESFSDQIEHYLNEIYEVSELLEYYNDHVLEDIIDNFVNWVEETFNVNLSDA